MSSAPATTAKDCPICDGDERWSSPYCPHWSTVVAGISRTQPRHEHQSKADVLADYDSRMAAAVAGVAPVNPKIRKQGHDGENPALVPVVQHIEGAESCCVNHEQAVDVTHANEPSAIGAIIGTEAPHGATATTRSSSAPKRKRRGPKKPKRTTEQVRRAADQEARAADYRGWWTSLGTATEGQMEEERAWLETLNTTENE